MSAFEQKIAAVRARELELDLEHLAFEVSTDLAPDLERFIQAQGGQLTELRKHLEEEYCYRLPLIRFRDDSFLRPGSFAFFMNGFRIFAHSLEPDEELADLAFKAIRTCLVSYIDELQGDVRLHKKYEEGE
jgi:flagellar biosynthesis component FlhA